MVSLLVHIIATLLLPLKLPFFVTSFIITIFFLGVKFFCESDQSVYFQNKGENDPRDFESLKNQFDS